MTRTRRSARQAGTRFESLCAGYLARVLGDGRIERRAKCGAKDRGDVAGLMFHGQRVVLECKDCATTRLPEWLAEAEEERGNDDAALAFVAFKRRGVSDPAEQYVACTLGTLAAVLAGGPGLLREDEE